VKDSQDCAAEVFSARFSNSPQTGLWHSPRDEGKKLHASDFDFGTVRKPLSIMPSFRFLSIRSLHSLPDFVDNSKGNSFKKLVSMRSRPSSEYR
jgi:hypothetical protein